jgi:hypothetical protein
MFYRKGFYTKIEYFFRKLWFNQRDLNSSSYKVARLIPLTLTHAKKYFCLPQSRDK